ncbi:hypothetical protein D3C75_1305120 [compost metagenome]
MDKILALVNVKTDGGTVPYVFSDRTVQVVFLSGRYRQYVRITQMDLLQAKLAQS